ncbi:MAG: SemiSWEET transporter [Amaricoccus sp.]|uniref:SemiSWEET family sugar transporter n=1 Tax=Amaricoccus sp. TaxID=1872485 RepID=UPI0039E4AABA
MDSTEYLGFIASIFGTVAFLPQVAKTWRTQSAQDFSLATLLLLEAGVGLWMVYGILRAAPAIWFGNGVTFCLAGYILIVKLRGARRPAPRP